MSHFAVAVISDGTKTIQDLLAPYQENNMGDCPKQYMEFHCTEDEAQEEYENGEIEKVRLVDGTLRSKYDEEYRVPADPISSFNTADKYKFPAGSSLVSIPRKDVYPTLKAYIDEYRHDPLDKETGRYGYWENPNTKWDWWEVGGRWHGYLRGGDVRRIGDCDFSPYPDAYESAIREWELAVEGRAKEDGECPPIFKSEYYTERFKNKEEFAEISSMWSTRAVITPDGVWHEVGEMGWWGCSSEGRDEIDDWHRHYHERFIDSADPDWIIAIVDCHI